MRLRFLLIPFVLALSGLIFPAEDKNALRKYWYQGKAELTSYTLDQSRYGEVHKGESVLIFVTEPFLMDKQVKQEYGDSSKAISVLKLNFTRRFFTGIYPYTMMTSVFTPVDIRGSRTVKVSSSVQEWCGQTYMQLNLKNGRYHGLLHSYFQREADQNVDLQGSWLEDEIWTRIRLAPETLPTGELDIVPGLQFLRLGHADLKAQKATATLSQEQDSQRYVLDYKGLKRRLAISFAKSFPYSIARWEERAPGGFDPGSPLLTTRAVRKKTLLLDYWDRHQVSDSVYRERLGLTQK